VQTDVVIDTRVTPNPDDAVALTKNGAAPRVWFAIRRKVIVWLAGLTVKLLLTAGAAA